MFEQDYQSAYTIIKVIPLKIVAYFFYPEACLKPKLDFFALG